MKVTGSLRHLFGRVDKKQIPPPPNRHITGATTGVFSASTSVWGALVRAMKNPARFSRPGFYTRISAYTFLHESCCMSRQIYRQTNLQTEIPSCISLACSSARPAASQLARRHSGAESLTHRHGGRRIATAGTCGYGFRAPLAEPVLGRRRAPIRVLAAPGMTTSRVCDALQLSRVGRLDQRMLARTNVRCWRKETWRGWLGRGFDPQRAVARPKSCLHKS